MKMSESRRLSEYLRKSAMLEWLESEMSINKGHPDDIDIHWTLNRVSKKILSGAFDADNSEIQRLRAACEDYENRRQTAAIEYARVLKENDRLRAAAMFELAGLEG